MRRASPTFHGTGGVVGPIDSGERMPDDDPKHEALQANGDGGLHAPRGILGSVEPPARRSAGRVGFQLVGFLIGLGLLAWVLRIALSEENRPTVTAFLDAPAHLLAAMVVLTAAAIVVNGGVFWVLLLPLRRLSLLEIVGVNTACTFISLLPFKISTLVRVLYHHRRDGVPLRDIVSWFAAVGVCGLAILGPLFVVSLWRQRLDWVWVVASLATTGSITAMAVPVSRLAGGGRGGRKGGRRGGVPILHRLSLGADRILRHPRIVATQYCLRLMDLSTVAGRFYVAGLIIGLPLPFDRAVLLGSTYFLIAVLSPASALGFAEMGTVAIARLTGLDADAVAVAALSVTLANVATAGVGSIPAFFWLRPDRVLAPGRATG